MAAGQEYGGRPERGRPAGPQRGIPDGLFVGFIVFLLGLTLLVWSATGLAGLFSRGGWPDGVSLARTPLATRQLAARPSDLAAAWPDTPKAQLSGHGLFWGILISELMVLLVLTIFTVGTVARYRIVRAKRRAAGRAAAGGWGEPRPKAGHSATDGPSGQNSAPTVAVAGQPARYRALATPPDGASGVGHPPGPETAVVHEGPTPSAVSGAGSVPTGVTPVPGVEPAAGVTRPGEPDAPQAPESIGARSEGSGSASLLVPWPAQRSGSPLLDGGSAHSRVLYGIQRGDAAAQAVLAADGPVLVVTSAPGLWAATRDARATSGPLHVFDPTHLLDTPARLRWSPVAGCASRDVAMARASALLAPVRSTHAAERPMAEAAETMLRCWLHAAAVDGRPFRHVHRWAQGNSAHEPVRILRTHAKAAGGAAGELEATLTAHPERRDLAQRLTARALAALSSIHIRDACNPGRADSLAIESFINEGGTLYLVGESIEDPRTDPGAMPLLTALASSVVERGRRMADRSAAGRLDPPLTVVLDDVAAVAPIPALPDLLSQGAAQGLPTLALMRSQEQARARWPHHSLVG